MTPPKQQMKAGDGDSRHGTVGGYHLHHCRCPECTRAHRLSYNAWQRKQVPPPPGDKRHGTYSCYVNYNCRCEPCTDAQYDYKQGKKQRP